MPGAARSVTLLLAALVACRASDGGVAPVRRLAHEEARAAGRHEPDTFELDMTTRYVLGGGLGVWRPGTVVVDDAGYAHLEVTCPADLAGRVAVLGATTLAAADALRTRLLRRRCPDSPGRPMAVPVGRVPAGTEMSGGARIREAPSARITTGPMTLPRGAELRLAVGVARPSGEPPPAPRPFSVQALAPDGRRLTLLRDTVAADGRWTELRVPLEPARTWLGSRVQLVFAQAPSPDDQATWVVWGNPTIWAPRPARESARPPNVLLVSIDTLRADRLGAYGYPLPITPVLDALAREGTLFEQAVAQASWTAPSHATMLTGTYPCVHGISLLKPQAVVGHPLPAGVRPLAEILAAAGYTTAAFTENAFVDPGSFQRGFDLFVADSRVEESDGPAPVATRTPGLVHETVERAVGWLGAHAGEPFFLFVHTYQVHEPFTPPAAYESLAAMRPLPAPPGALPPAPEAEENAAKYTAEVAYTDAALAPLVGTLDALGLADETIVIATSDHGESFGEKGVLGHGTSIQEEQIRVPLVWRAPGRVAAGQRIASLVGVVDIVPTVLRLLDLPTPLWMQGVSLHAMLRPGYRDSGVSSRVLPAEAFGMIGLRGDTWKVERLVYGGFRSVHVTAHGEEPLVRRAPAAVTSGAFAQFERECRRAQALLGAGAAPPSRADEASDPERERKLRALGYLE